MSRQADVEMIGQIEIKSKDSVLGVFVAAIVMSRPEVEHWRMLTLLRKSQTLTLSLLSNGNRL
jgi:hypothetical protein